MSTSMPENFKNEKKIFFHIDVNSAYLSWSAIKLLKEGYPEDIRKIPAIVGGDREKRHGIVVAKSIPAKQYGIETAEPVTSALKKCPGLFMVPPDHGYYKQKSTELMEYLSGICPAIEQVSIDECYMDYSPIKDRYDNPYDAATAIRDGVREKFGFTVNVGISDVKVLAKMASDFEKPNKIHTLYRSELPQKLWPLPIRKLHMCGKSSSKRFEELGIHTIGDLAHTDVSLIRSLMKSHGELLWNYANGFDDSVVVTKPSKAKGIGNSVTLSKDIRSKEEAFRVLQSLSQSVSSRLLKHQSLTSQISVEIKYATFKTVSHQMICKTPCNREEEIFKYACKLFSETWNGDPVRLLGIRTTKLSDEKEPVQLDLFGYQEYLKKEEESKKYALVQEERARKNRQMEEAMLKIKEKYGKNIIKKGIDFNES